jgi:hypothetical protein
MILSAPKWLAWIYAVCFWVFVIAALLGGDALSALALLGLKVMFFGLAVFWIGAVILRVYRTQPVAAGVGFGRRHDRTALLTVFSALRPRGLPTRGDENLLLRVPRGTVAIRVQNRSPADGVSPPLIRADIHWARHGP